VLLSLLCIVLGSTGRGALFQCVTSFINITYVLLVKVITLADVYFHRGSSAPTLCMADIRLKFSAEFITQKKFLYNQQITCMTDT
jgi:hypothetical protein